MYRREKLTLSVNTPWVPLTVESTYSMCNAQLLKGAQQVVVGSKANNGLLLEILRRGGKSKQG